MVGQSCRWLARNSVRFSLRTVAPSPTPGSTLATQGESTGETAEQIFHALRSFSLSLSLSLFLSFWHPLSLFEYARSLTVVLAPFLSLSRAVG